MKYFISIAFFISINNWSYGSNSEFTELNSDNSDYDSDFKLNPKVNFKSNSKSKFAITQNSHLYKIIINKNSFNKINNIDCSKQVIYLLGSCHTFPFYDFPEPFKEEIKTILGSLKRENFITEKVLESTKWHSLYEKIDDENLNREKRVNILKKLITDQDEFFLNIKNNFENKIKTKLDQEKDYQTNDQTNNQEIIEEFDSNLFPLKLTKVKSYSPNSASRDQYYGIIREKFSTFDDDNKLSFLNWHGMESQIWNYYFENKDDITTNYIMNCISDNNSTKKDSDKKINTKTALNKDKSLNDRFLELTIFKKSLSNKKGKKEIVSSVKNYSCSMEKYYSGRTTYYSADFYLKTRNAYWLSKAVPNILSTSDMDYFFITGIAHLNSIDNNGDECGILDFFIRKKNNQSTEKLVWHMDNDWKKCDLDIKVESIERFTTKGDFGFWQKT